MKLYISYTQLIACSDWILPTFSLYARIFALKDQKHLLETVKVLLFIKTILLEVTQEFMLTSSYFIACNFENFNDFS